MDLQNEKKIVLSDEILMKQLCSKCSKYLSVWPIYQSADRILCGRCCYSTENGFRLSTYNHFAECFLFKCVNHYSGCKEMRSFFDMFDHEKYCTIKLFVCYLCKFKGVGSQLIHHFLQQHSKNIVANDGVKIKLENGFEEFYFYWEYDHIFIIKVSVLNNYMGFNLLSLRGKNSLITHYSLRFSRSELSKLRYDTDVFDCVLDITLFDDVNNNNNQQVLVKKILSIFGPIQPLDNCVVCTILLKYTDEITSHNENVKIIKKQMQISKTRTYLEKLLTSETDKIKKYESYIELFRSFLQINLPSVICNQCQENISNNMYMCPQMHSFCVRCFKGYCEKCNTFTEGMYLENLQQISVMCIWKNCTKENNILELYKHEQICANRMFNCPVNNCPWIGSLTELFKHGHIMASKLIRGREINLKPKCAQFYWLVFPVNELFLVKVNLTKSGIRKLFVTIEDKCNVFSGSCTFKIKIFRNKHEVECLFEENSICFNLGNKDSSKIVADVRL